MPSQSKLIKRALRFNANCEYRHAALEMSALIDGQKDAPALAYLLRGRAREALKRYPGAIADYVHALSSSLNLNVRNRLSLLESMIVCAAKLSDEQRSSLSEILAEEFNLKKIRDLVMVAAPVKPRCTAQPFRQPALTAHLSAPGRIVNIGKFLLDEQDIEKIKRIVAESDGPFETRTLSTCRPVAQESPYQSCEPPPSKTVLSQADAAKWRERLKKIAKQKDVIGSCVTEQTGLPIISTMPADLDAEWCAIHSLGIFRNSARATHRASYGQLFQAVLRSPCGYVVIVDTGGGFLITATREMNTAKLQRLLKKLVAMVAESPLA